MHLRTEKGPDHGHWASERNSHGRAGCPRADPLQASGDLNSSGGYSAAQSGPCTALIWPKKGWNPGAGPSQVQSVHKPVSASGLSLENGQGASARWRGWGKRSQQIRDTSSCLLRHLGESGGQSPHMGDLHSSPRHKCSMPQASVSLSIQLEQSFLPCLPPRYIVRSQQGIPDYLGFLEHSKGNVFYS